MKCYDKALSLLAIREHSEKELGDKLLQKGYGKEEIAKALSQIKEEGFISDERFAKAYVSSRMKKHPEGKSLMLMRLMQKGVARVTSKKALDEYFIENNEEIQSIYKAFAEKLTAKKGREKCLMELSKRGIRMSGGEEIPFLLSESEA